MSAEINTLLASQDINDLMTLSRMFDIDDGEEIELKKLDTKTINNLPDSAFAIILPGGKKDKSGKTTPRSLRKFPIHDKAHVRNALARINQSKLTPAQKAKALKKIRAAAKKFGIKTKQNDPGRSSMSDVIAGASPDTKAVAAPAAEDAQEGVTANEPTAEAKANEATPVAEEAVLNAAAETTNAPAPQGVQVDVSVDLSQDAVKATQAQNSVELAGQVDALALELNAVKEQLANERVARQQAEFAKIIKDVETVATKEQVALLNQHGLALAASLAKDVSILKFAADLILAGAGKPAPIIPEDETTQHAVETIGAEVEARLNGYKAGLKRRNITGKDLEELVAKKRVELVGPDA